MKVRVRTMFYHEQVGRRPHPKLDGGKGAPFFFPDELVDQLPSDAVIVEGSDEIKARHAENLKARKAAIAEAREQAAREKQNEVMESFIGAIKGMTAVAGQIAEDKPKRGRPKKDANTVHEEAEA